MIVSLNEVEARALKAARGAGLAWGLAEEAGAAARFLAARRVDWVASLAALLGAEPMVSPPIVDGAILRPADPQGWLCPIRTGAFLSDLGLADALVERVLHPLWLVPFVTRGAEGPRCLAWPGAILHLTEHAIAWTEGDAIGAPYAAQVTIGAATTPTVPGSWHRPASGGVDVDDAAWAALGRFEALTYVPESAATRLFGAGTGLLTDND